MAQEQIGYGLGTYDPNATDEGLTPLEDAIMGLMQGVGSFFQAKQLRKDTQAQMQLQHQKLLMEMDKLATEQGFKRQEIANEVTKNANTYNLGVSEEAGRAQRNQEDNQRALDVGGMNQEYESARQQHSQDFQKNVLFPHQLALRQTVPGGTVDANTGMDRRANLRRAEEAVKMLMEQGVLDPQDPNFQQQYSDALQFYSLTPDEQGVYLQEKADQDATIADEAFQAEIPRMRQDAIGALGKLPEAQRRINELSQQSGGPVRFEDIYGAPATQVIGEKGQPPTAMVSPPDEQGNVYRVDPKTGTYQPNMTPFKRALELQRKQAAMMGRAFPDAERNLPYRGTPRK